MPFTEPTNITVQVTQADIDNASAGRATNSLAQAIKRLADNSQLAGQENDTTPQSCGWYAEVSIRVGGGLAGLITVAEAFVCTRVYSITNLEAIVIVATENVGLAPSQPYEAVLELLP